MLAESPNNSKAALDSASQGLSARSINEQEQYPLTLAPEAARRDLKFWMCFACITICTFLVGLDIAGVTTALPTIVKDLKGEQFEWVGSAYALSATAFLPLSGGVAQVFGRRSSMLIQISFFALGSALCGAATNMNFLIAGRAVQGVGAGGLTSLSQILISDLVPLHERGIFNAFLALAYAVSAGIATPIAGILADAGQWRWFFYMNLPFCGLAGFLAALFINVHITRGSFRDKFLRLDWIGNSIVVASTTSAIIGLTWGGVQYSWSSPRVLVPLIVGIAGIVAFLVYDAKVPRHPLVPYKVLSSTEAISGYLQGFFTNFYMLGVYYYIPVYFQACKGTSPTRSGVLGLPSSLVTMPTGIIAGLSVAKSGGYRVQLWTAWVAIIVSAGLYCTLNANTSIAAPVGFQIIGAFGLGIGLTCAFFPVLAPISLSLHPNALAFFLFIRFFAQSWGVSVGGTVLQNQLKKRLPSEFLSQFPGGTAVAYSIIPVIPSLPEPLRSEVRDAFADSLHIFWEVLIGIGALGLLASLMMRGLSLKTDSGNKKIGEELVEVTSS